MDDKSRDIDHIEASLAVLGWNGNALAERCGVTPKTVSGWRTGKVRVPGSVSSYLSLAVWVKGFPAKAVG